MRGSSFIQSNLIKFRISTIQTFKFSLNICFLQFTCYLFNCNIWNIFFVPRTVCRWRYLEFLYIALDTKENILYNSLNFNISKLYILKLISKIANIYISHKLPLLLKIEDNMLLQFSWILQDIIYLFFLLFIYFGIWHLFISTI